MIPILIPLIEELDQPINLFSITPPKENTEIDLFCVTFQDDEPPDARESGLLIYPEVA